MPAHDDTTRQHRRDPPARSSRAEDSGNTIWKSLTGIFATCFGVSLIALVTVILNLQVKMARVETLLVGIQETVSSSWTEKDHDAYERLVEQRFADLQKQIDQVKGNP